MTDFHFTITESAASRIAKLMDEEKSPHAAFRITIEGGGCSGFQYLFSIDKEEAKPNDHVFTLNGAVVRIDDISMPFVNGGSVDFVENLTGSAFEIVNPQSTSRCGCGTSFSVL